MKLTKQEAKDNIKALKADLALSRREWGGLPSLEKIKEEYEIGLEIKGLEEYIEGLEEEQDEWPQEGDKVWYTVNGVLHHDYWLKNRRFGSNTEAILEYKLKIGRLFRTDMEALDYDNWLKARATLVKRIAELNDGWKPDWEDLEQSKYHIGYESYGEDELFCEWTECQYHPEGFYLKSKEAGDYLIKEHEEELKIYFGIK